MPSPRTPLVQLSNLRIDRDGRTILRDISLDVPRGSITAVQFNVPLSNSGGAPITTPHLSARAWRVRFKLTLPSGHSQTRHS